MKRLLRMDSLQARLRMLILGLVVAVWLGAALMTWVDARHELDELLDGHLAQAAALLVAQKTNTHSDHDGDAGRGFEDAPSLHKYAPRVAFQVFHEGQLVMRSANAGVTPMSETARGYATVRLAGDAPWRVFAARGNEIDVQVFVAEQIDARDHILWAVMRSVFLPLIFALPVLALAIWWAVRRGLAPVHRLSSVLAQRPAHANALLPIADLPAELRPMVQSLNGLLARMEQMMLSERRFTADAAHELRTPIAGIRAQAQVALGAGSHLEQRTHALQATLAGCDRAARVVEQLLTLSRLEAAAGSGSSPLPPVNLAELVRRVAADLAPAALARQQSLEFAAPSASLVAGDDTLLGVLVRNLIDNALRYSPNSSTVRVSVLQEQNQTRLRVQDSGAGMAAKDMARLGERFFRVLGHDQPGSGLGWSIVRRVADVSGATIEVGHSDRLGGLMVTVSWPAYQGESPQG